MAKLLARTRARCASSRLCSSGSKLGASPLQKPLLRVRCWIGASAGPRSGDRGREDAQVRNQDE